MRSIAVYCGSSNGASDVYLEAAASLGRELAKRGIALVYGGSSVGLMGAVADAALAAGGRAIGVLPEFLQRREIGHKSLTELKIVGTMHERKAHMAELSDGFIVLPGGPGTMEEYFEIFTWARIGLHRKPIGLMNTGRYYDPLVNLLRHMAQEQFMDENSLSLTVIEEEPAALLDRLQAREAPEPKAR